MKVLVVYASRHGGTRGIAERIGEVLAAEGCEAPVVAPDAAPAVASFDAVVIGSGVYMGSWLKEATEFIDSNQEALATLPVWLFSSGPLPGSSRTRTTQDPITDSLGPTDGLGSGGRQRIEALSRAIHPRDHQVFEGAFDPADPPRTMPERLLRMMPSSNRILPPGDFRDWPAIEAWAHAIARALRPVTAIG
jgi:menaquinone-dependent protoporphyrinogen oxidase